MDKDQDKWYINESKPDDYYKILKSAKKYIEEDYPASWKKNPIKEAIKSFSIKDIISTLLMDFKTETILDELDDTEIQQYLRKKKIARLNKTK